MYDEILQQASLKIAFLESHGDSLCTTAAVDKNVILFEDSPLICYLLPARYGLPCQYCMNCLAPLQNEVVRCYHCDFTYCSYECRYRHFIYHFGLCLGACQQQRAQIVYMHTETRTISGYAIAEVLCSICAKIAIKLVEGQAFEQAYDYVLAPYMFLAHSYAITMDFPVKQQFKYTQLVLRYAGKKLGFVEDVSGIFNALLNLDLYKCLLSVVALNGSGIVIGNELVGIGVYNIASKMNHACSPNCVLYWMSNSTVYVKTEEIVEYGEELTIRYCYEGLSYDERYRVLAEGWGFRCQCSLCLYEGQKGDCL